MHAALQLHMHMHVMSSNTDEHQTVSSSCMTSSAHILLGWSAMCS